MADTFTVNLDTAGDRVVCANTIELCSHPRGRRFDAVCHTIGGHPAGEERRLCGDCGWDFGPTAALNNLGRITSELWAATEGAEYTIDPERYIARRARLVLDRWGVTARWYDHEVAARLDNKAAYYSTPVALSLVDPWGTEEAA
jgi:hypothetical protein